MNNVDKFFLLFFIVIFFPWMVKYFFINLIKRRQGLTFADKIFLAIYMFFVTIWFLVFKSGLGLWLYDFYFHTNK